MTESMCECGHPKSLHELTNGYRPYGHCNYQHDLCSCKEYRPAASPQQEQKPLWAVALDKMRSHDGLRRTDGDVSLTADEAYAFVKHYLDTSYRLDHVTEANHAAAAILRREP